MQGGVNSLSNGTNNNNNNHTDENDDRRSESAEDLNLPPNFDKLEENVAGTIECLRQIGIIIEDFKEESQEQLLNKMFASSSRCIC